MDIETEPNELTDDTGAADENGDATADPDQFLVESGAVGRVRRLVAPILDDLGLDVYDLEHRGGVLRLTLDTPMGTSGGVTLDKLALASRLVSKELDAEDPIVSRYTLEVTSPGIERPLRRPDHFRRAIGQPVAIRLSDVESADRRVTGTVVAADDAAVTVGTDDGERTIDYGQIDRARTVFEWGGQEKGAKPAKRKHAAPATADVAGDETKHASERQRASDQPGLEQPGNAIEGDEL